MKDQINTIREALESCNPGDWSSSHVIHPSYDDAAVEKALTALAQIEADHAHDLASAAAQGHRDGVASAQGQEPVGTFWQHPKTKEWYQQNDGEPLYRAAPVVQQPQAEAAETVNETNAVLASRYFDLLRVVEQYEKNGVTCQTYRHFVTEPCAECNSPGRCAKQAAPLHQILTDPENQPNQYGVEFLMHGPKFAFKVGTQQFTLDYEPTEPGDFEFMRDALIRAFSVFTEVK